MAVQIASALNARVWATASAGSQDMITGLGAITFDYNKVSTQDIMNASPEGAGYDVIYDAVGGPVLDASLSGSSLRTYHQLCRF